MSLGCGIMVVGPRRSHNEPGARVFCGATMNLRWPRFLSRRKTLSAPHDGHSSSEELLPSYVDFEGTSEGLPETLASFDPEKLKSGDFLQRYRARRFRDKARERRSGAPSLESVDVVSEQKSHEKETNSG